MKRWLGLVAAGLMLGGLYLSSRYSYLLFHSLAEIFSIVIAAGMFMVAWNTRQWLEGNWLRLLGIAFLFVGGLDLVHTLAYAGMPIFRGYGTNLPTQLWVASRVVQGVSLLAAAWPWRRPLRAERLFLIYGGVTLLLLLSIFAWHVFPDCFIEGVGLTPFKRGSEYVITLLLAGAIGSLLKNRTAFDPQVLRWLVWSLVLAIGSELAFTLYTDAYGVANLVGHYLKIVSFYLIYKAIIETGLARPYAVLFRELKQSEERYRQAQEQLARANENLEQVVQERTASLRETVAELERYSYSIAHDMRAPLRSMRMFSQVLVEDHGPGLAPEVQDYLQRIAGAANRLDRLVEDVLSYSRVSRAEIKRERHELEPLVRQIVEQYPRLHAREGQIQIAGPLLPVTGNLGLLTQCVSNLLDNAIKFVAPGVMPRVRVWTERRGGSIRLWVEDNGIGIGPKDQGRIWEIFAKVHSREEYEGTGIGLSIVRKAVERMGGQTGVESEPGKGSRFWIELPAGD